MIQLMRVLKRFNEFKMWSQPGPNPRTLPEHKERDKAEKLAEIDYDYIHIEHVSYVNFTKFNLPQPIYMNLVRDPVERVISWFFYIRGAHKNAIFFRKHPEAPVRDEKWFKKDFNKCVRTGDVECVYEQFSITDTDFRRQSLFFCGNDRDCLPFNSQSAVQVAKQNVEKYYAVVGSWEDTNVTLTVLEKFIPRYFYGAKLLFEINHDKITNQNKNTRKPKIDHDVKEMLRKNFTNEYDFYHFCKQRLYKQYLSLKLNELDLLRK